MNRSLKWSVSLALLAGCAPAPSAEHDYFRNIRYPGERRPDVGLDRIEQEGGPDAADGYVRRVVHWWPKRGVDVIPEEDIPPGAPLCTWTIRSGEVEPLLEAGMYAKWWPSVLRGRKRFDAHLIGFRGIGSALGNPFDDAINRRVYGRGVCPAVVLRLEDGRKRCFTRGSFADEDQAFIIELYEKEMARLRGTLEPPPAKLRPGTAARWPQGTVYTPGTFRTESDHFVVCAGSQNPVGRHSPWVNEKRREETRLYREATMRTYEDFWAYNEYAGHLMPFWEKPEQYKYTVTVPGTMRDGFGEIPGFAGGGYGACGIRGASWHALYHEWGHGTVSGGMLLLGGAETLCDAHQTMADPTVTGKVGHQIDRPYKNLFHGQYPGGLAYAMMADDPNWGYAAVATFTSLMADGEHTPMHAIARLGRERGIWKNGVRGMGDMMGQIGARFAEYDCELEAGLRKTFPSPNRAYLAAVDRKAGLYRSPPAEAPEPFGVNIVRLILKAGAKRLTVDFRGHYDPDTYSDWRACIVAVDSDGRSRYSPLWNGGEMSLEARAGDRRYWLTVTATPFALTSSRPNARGSVNHVYQGGFTYKYPYDVRLTGCRPGNPHAPGGVNENMDLVGPAYARGAITGNNRGGALDWPHPADTPGYEEMKRTLEAVLAKAPAVRELYLQDGLYANRFGWWHSRAAASPVLLEWRAKYLLENALGRRHANGGGWVARSATVAPTAYVGPDCMVLDGARVLDNAVIEDCAVVSGPKVLVKDNARVYGKAVVCGAAALSGHARVSRNIMNRSSSIAWNRDDPDAPPYSFEMTTGSAAARDGPEERVEVFRDAGFKLQANYAFDRPETVRLEDWYQEHSYGGFASGAHMQDLVFYDGVLHGRPGFVIDGDVRAFTFNGTDQYAEADGAVADLGAITVDVSLRWDGGGGGGRQTVFDFGASPRDCLKLTIAPSGVPELVAVRGGRRETVPAGRALPGGEWVACRAEIDGKRMSLWLNGEKAAERRSDFRAADAYPAGAEKRSFIAASRERTDFFRGAIDYLRIYFTVYEDFAAAPGVPMVSSRRIDPGFIERFEKRFADYEEKEAEFAAGVKATDMYRFYERWNRRVDARIAELGYCDEVGRLESELEGLKASLEARKRELASGFNEKPEIRERRKRYEDLNAKWQKRWRELQQEDEEHAAAAKARDEARSARSRIERAAFKELGDELRDLRSKRKAAQDERNAYVASKLKTDPRAVKVGEERKAVLDELRAVDRAKGPERHAKLQARERELDRAYRDVRNSIARDDAESRRLDGEVAGLNRRERAMMLKVAGRDPEYGRAAARQKKAEDRARELDRALRKHADLVSIQSERDAFNTRDSQNLHVSKGSQELSARVKEKGSAIKKLRQETATARNADEYYALTGLGWGRRQYGRAVERRLKTKVLPLMPEDRKQMREALPFQRGRWHTRVDWDGRTRWEKSGEELSPIMQRWLGRTKPYMYE